MLSWLNAFRHGGSITLNAFSINSFLLMLIPLFFLKRRGKSAGYLLCFYLFSVYLWAVLAYTIVDFPFNSIEAKFIRMRSWSNEIRLVPRFLSGDFDVVSVQVYGNFLLGIPFGFGLPFVIARSTHKRMVLLGLGFAAGIELAQLLLGLLIYQAPYRVIDIDDVWLVFVGTLTGYGALWVAAHVYRRLGWEDGARLPVWSHLHEILIRVASDRAPPLVSPSPTDAEGCSPGDAHERSGHEKRSDEGTPHRTGAESAG